MALAYRALSFTSAGNASSANLLLPTPVGVANNDIMIAGIYAETDTNTITPPAGWTSLFRQVNTGAFMLEAFWKRAASEPANYTWTDATAGNQWMTGVTAAYSGGTGTGTVKDSTGFGGSQADAVAITSQTAPSITPTSDGVMVVFVYGNFGGTDVTAMTGFCANFRGSTGGIVIADAHQTTHAATGTSRPSAGPGSQTYAAMHVALIDATGGVTAKSLPLFQPAKKIMRTRRWIGWQADSLPVSIPAR
jgi:hypothetical protein